jgi:beta-lactamase regulating signal transducer with metallopeptidase domain
MTAWLLTWLLQGGVLAAGVAVALRGGPRLNAATKHLIWWVALAALAWLAWASSPYRAPYWDLTPVEVRGSDPIYVPSAPDFLISTSVGIWLAITLVSLLRVLPSLRAVYALRGRCRPVPSSLELRLPLWLEAQKRGRRAALMLCDAVPGAAVLGFQRPYIAVPASLVEALTCDELDQVILHEHAHVQRLDDWSRLAQTLMLSVLWIHPAALLVSRALNREREMACDEWVVARTGLPKAYARCLARAAEARGRTRSGWALSPTLIGGRHELVRRVDRVLAMNGTARRDVSFAAAAAAACAIALTSAQLQTVHGFAEIAEIALPRVSRPKIAAYAEAASPGTEIPTTVPLKRLAGRRAPLTIPLFVAARPIQASFGGTGRRVGDGANLDTMPMETLEARSFKPSYAPPSIVPAPGVQPSRWQALAAPGIEVALAAKKTSVGVAKALSRAGASLGRSF